MNEAWHIPRASLGGSISPPSSNSSNKSYSTLSTVSRNFKTKTNKNVSNIPNLDRNQVVNKENIRSASRHNTISHPKRGSRSSQGSNDSSNSIESASSGSLLLTAANLERFAEIQRQQNNSYLDSNNEFLNSNYIVNLTLDSNNSNLRKDAVVAIEPNSNFIKTKDVDTMSVASSTHFTMVNGEGGSSRKKAGGICSRGKQVTVLIISMSLFFLVVILGMVYALEMRAREMPKS